MGYVNGQGLPRQTDVACTQQRILVGGGDDLDCLRVLSLGKQTPCQEHILCSLEKRLTSHPQPLP